MKSKRERRKRMRTDERTNERMKERKKPLHLNAFQVEIFPEQKLGSGNAAKGQWEKREETRISRRKMYNC